MERKCDRCQVKYDDLFDTIVMYDYAEPGKGKPGHYHLCLNCRKELISWLEKTK
jgi:hypothetical protein